MSSKTYALRDWVLRCCSDCSTISTLDCQVHLKMRSIFRSEILVKVSSISNFSRTFSPDELEDLRSPKLERASQLGLHRDFAPKVINLFQKDSKGRISFWTTLSAVLDYMQGDFWLNTFYTDHFSTIEEWVEDVAVMKFCIRTWWPTIQWLLSDWRLVKSSKPRFLRGILRENELSETQITGETHLQFF